MVRKVVFVTVLGTPMSCCWGSDGEGPEREIRAPQLLTGGWVGRLKLERDRRMGPGGHVADVRVEVRRRMEADRRRKVGFG